MNLYLRDMSLVRTVIRSRTLLGILIHSEQIRRELHRIVTAVKKDGEVGLEYMKSVEIEKRTRQESREEERKTN